MNLVTTANFNESTAGFMIALASDAAISNFLSREHYLSFWENQTLARGFSQSFREVLTEVEVRNNICNVKTFIEEAFRRERAEVIVKSVHAGTLDLCYDETQGLSDAFIEGYTKDVTTPRLKTRVWGLKWLREQAQNPNVDFSSDAIALAAELTPRLLLENPALPFLAFENAGLLKRLTEVATRVIEKQEREWSRFNFPQVSLSNAIVKLEVSHG